jgi:YD repeat-containing protein
VAVKAGVETTEAADVNRPLTYTDYDNLGRAVTSRSYDADGVTPSVTNGVPQTPSSGLLRAKSTTEYDALGRAFRSSVYSVDPSSGSVSTNSLHTDTWFDARGMTVKTASPGGLVQKTAYDGVGRVTAQYSTDGGGGGQTTEWVYE